MSEPSEITSRTTGGTQTTAAGDAVAPERAAQPIEIVIASDQVDLVLSEIAPDRVGEKQDDADVIPQLGLTLIRIEADRVAGIVDELQDKIVRGEEGAEFKAKLDAKLDGRSDDLDRLLTYLRGVFEQRAGGWSPLMGKNRIVNGIQFQPYANAGSFDLPVPAGEVPDVRATLMDEPDGSTVIGLLDTAIVRNIEISRRVVAVGRPDPGLGDERPEGWRGHATFVSHVILQHAGPDATVLARTALGWQRDGSGRLRWTMRLWDFAKALVSFKGSGIRVLNLSLGMTTEDGKAPMVLERAIGFLRPEIAIVAAAGNYGPSERTSPQDREDRKMPQPGEPFFPAALPGVIAVGALEGATFSAGSGVVSDFNPAGSADGVAEWIDIFVPSTAHAAYFGSARSPVDVQLPGTKGGTLTPREPFRGLARWTGTSFSAAWVTGEIAAEFLANGGDLDAAVAMVRGRYQRPRKAAAMA